MSTFQVQVFARLQRFAAVITTVENGERIEVARCQGSNVDAAVLDALRLVGELGDEADTVMLCTAPGVELTLGDGRKVTEMPIQL